MKKRLKIVKEIFALFESRKTNEDEEIKGAVPFLL